MAGGASASLVLFYVFAAIAVAGALSMVANVRNTVAGALSLVATMIALGAIYVLLGAYLIGVLQILIYAGAILVLFLFVVMLLNLRQDDFSQPRQRFLKALAVLVAAGVLVWFVALLPQAFGEPAAVPEGYGGYRQVGLALFRNYLLAFDATSLLLLAALVGAVVLAKRSID